MAFIQQVVLKTERFKVYFVENWQIQIRFLKAAFIVKYTRIVLLGAIFDWTMMFIRVACLKYLLVLKCLLYITGNFIKSFILLVWAYLKYTLLSPFSTIIYLLIFMKDNVLTLNFLSFCKCQLHCIFNGFFHRRFGCLLLCSVSIFVQHRCKAVYLLFLLLDY